MPKTLIATTDAPKAIGPYCQAVLVDGPPKRTLYCAGQIPLDPRTGDLVAGDITVQTERVLDNVQAVLAAAGMSFANVVKTTVYLTDLGDFAKMNESYAKRFGASPPARSTVPVSALPKGSRVEIEVLAVEV